MQETGQSMLTQAIQGEKSSAEENREIRQSITFSYG